MNWRLLYTPAASGSWNMAVDEIILRGVESGMGPPTLRLYSWQPACLSLGHSQKIDSEVNVPALQSAGIDVVRRFTGGRAVLHWNEWTYSVIGPISTEWSQSLSSTYETIGRMLSMALKNLGAEADLERGDHVEKFAKGRANRPCFASTSRSELVVQGKKMAGSAQRRTSTAFLQHGSLLLGDEHLQIADFLILSPEEKINYRQQLQSHSVTLQSIGLYPKAEDFISSLEMAWAGITGVFPIRQNLDDRELNLIPQYMQHYQI